MFNLQDYSNAVNVTGVKNGSATSVNYQNYCLLENLWDDYFNNIFIPNANFINKKFLRVIFLESYPAGNPPFPNYIFNYGQNSQKQNSQELNGIIDRYLCQVLKGFSATTKMSKQDALILLAKENVLLMDIFFSHGFSLGTAMRKVFNNNLNMACDFDKIVSTINRITTIQNNSMRILFATPPTIDINAIFSGIGLGKMYGSMTSGSSSPSGSMTRGSNFPSFKILINKINVGF